MALGKLVLTLCLLCLGSGPALAGLDATAPSPEIESLVVFGDSLSDNGFDDGHGFQRYSNGKVWPEYLGELMGLEQVEVRAWGGALSGRGNYNAPAKDWSGLLWQVDQYRPLGDPAKALVQIEIGFNDLHDPSSGIRPESVIANLRTALDQLAAKGIRQVVVWNLPTSVTPPGYTDPDYAWYSYYKDQRAKAFAAFASYNQLLPAALAEFRQSHPDMKVRLFDLDAGMTEIATGFTTLDKPWLGSYRYPAASQWLFWDHWHFMTEVHRRLAELNDRHRSVAPLR